MKVTTADGKIKVGRISKQWTGLAKELFTDADNFGIQFPMDLDVNVKATLLGAIFLIVSHGSLLHFMVSVYLFIDLDIQGSILIISNLDSLSVYITVE